MKRHILPILLITLAGTLCLHAEESFRLTGFTAWQGECDTLAITVNGATDVTAFQADLSLPEGIVYSGVALNAGRAAADHTVSVVPQADGTLRVGCWSPTNSVFTGDTGPMVYVLLTVSESMLSGKYEVTLTNGIITRAGGRTITPKDAQGRLYIGDYTAPPVDYSSPVDIREQSAATAYKIRNISADKLMSLNTAKGSVTVEEADDNTPDQTFYLEPDFNWGEGYYQLRNSSGKYISAKGNWWEMTLVISDSYSADIAFRLDEEGDLTFQLVYDSFTLCARGGSAGSGVTLDWNDNLSTWQFYTIPVDHTDYLRELIERASAWKGLTAGNRDRDLRRAIHNAQIVIDACDSAHVDSSIETLVSTTWAARAAYKEGDTSKAENEWGDAEHVIPGDYVVAYVDAQSDPHYLTINEGKVELTDDFCTFQITDGNTVGGDGSTTPYAAYASFMESNGYFLSNPQSESPSTDKHYTISTQAVNGSCGLQRRTWESQVFYYNPVTDLYAIRLTNSTGTAWGPDFYAYVDPATLEVTAAARSLNEALRTWTILTRERAVTRFLATSGSCGTNVKWSFDTETGILYISGKGNMKNYTTTAPAPWYPYADMIQTVVVCGSIERLGNRCFNGCTNLRTLVLATSSKATPGSYTFRDVPAGLVVKVPSLTTFADWGSSDEFLSGRVLETVLDLPATLTYNATKQKMEAAVSVYGITTPDLKLQKEVGTYSLETTATITACGNTSSFTAVYDYAIVPATVVARPRDYSRNYGAKNPTFYVSYEGLMGSETASSLDQKATCSCEASLTSPVGEYVVTCSGAEDKNYVFVYETSTLTVKQARLRVKADNLTRYYGEPNPTFTFTWTGFANDEDESVLDELPVAQTDADETSDAGTYTITLQGGTAQNYTVVCSNGVLAIEALPQTIVWEQSSQTVAVGSSLELTATSSLGLPVAYTLSNDDVATLSGNTLTFQTEGEVVVTATQPGDKNHAAAEPVAHTFRVVSTGVGTLTPDSPKEATYDLLGRRITDRQQGIRIQGGKKTLKKE